MSIDAVITGYERQLNGNVTFLLADRRDEKGRVVGYAGQKYLTLEQPVHPLPPVGSPVWGGSGNILVNDGMAWRYKRIGYTKMVEA